MTSRVWRGHAPAYRKTIWITAQASTAKAVACTEAKPPDMTSPKGITVRITDSTKPVT